MSSKCERCQSVLEQGLDLNASPPRIVWRCPSCRAECDPFARPPTVWPIPRPGDPPPETDLAGRQFHNPHRLQGKGCWAIVVVSSLYALASSLFLLAGFDAGPHVVIGLVFAGCVLIPALMLQLSIIPRAEQHLEALRRGEYLVRWEYTADEWERWLEVRRARWGERTRSATGEAFISRDCVYFDDTYRTWKLSWNYWLAAVELKEGEPDWLEITIAWTGRGMQTATGRVPVPEGRREEAEAVLGELRLQERTITGRRRSG